MISVAFAILGGLIYGSFLNVLLWRLPQGQGINGRSHCRTCDHTLAWYDLVPVLSFLWLRAQCRYCQSKIHPRYPIVEFVTGAVLGMYFFTQRPLFDLDSVLIVAGILILTSLFFFDLFYLILPDAITIPGIIIFALALTRSSEPVSHLLAGLLMALFFAILYWISRGKQLGFGDVKLALLIGLMLGYPLGFIAVVSGIWAGALVGLGLMITRRLTRKDPLPLGAFLSAAALVSIIFSHEILDLVLQIF